MTNNIADATQREGGVRVAVEPLYRFLRIGDEIEDGDECPSDNCERWEPVNRWAIGSKASVIFKTIRRRVSSAPAPAPAEPAPITALYTNWRGDLAHACG